MVRNYALEPDEVDRGFVLTCQTYPVSGEVTAINAAVIDEPKVINDDPYGEGWIFKVRISDEPGDLLDAEAYTKLIEES